MPLSFKPEQTLDSARHSNNWDMIARLQPGVTVAAAQHRIDVLNKFQVERSGKLRTLLENARFASVVRGLKDEMVRDIKPTLYLLQAAVLLVLLIGCVNVANLMLVRSNIRMKELAIRHSLGAARGRLARQLLTESMTLAALGGLLGILLAYAGVRMLAVLGAQELPRGAAIHLDAGALAFSAVVAGLTGLVFGSVPVYHLMRRDLNVIFRQTGRTGTSERGAVWTRSALVVCQVSLAFVLLIGAGLLTLSFARLLNVSPGFQPQSVETAAFALPRSRYADDARVRNFLGSAMDAVRAIPGVTNAGVTTMLPFGPNNNNSVISIVGHDLGARRESARARLEYRGSGLFRHHGNSALAGPRIRPRRHGGLAVVVVIDRYMAHKYFPKGDAIGAQIILGFPDMHDDKNYICTVIGVAGSVKTNDLAERNPIGEIYFAAQQYPRRYMYMVVKSQRERHGHRGGGAAGICRADPGAAAVRREDHEPAAGGFGARTAGRHGHVRSFCGPGAGAIGHRNLRRAGVYGGAAHARIRHTDRAGRTHRHGNGDGDGAGNAARRHRPGVGGWRRMGADAAHGQDAIRRPTHRPAGIRHGGGDAAGRGTGGVARAVAARGADKAGGGVARGVMGHNVRYGDYNFRAGG